jgi:hypothetical protein
LIDLSTSYLRHKAINTPGRTISPRPSKENSGGEVSQFFGKRSLIGASMLFATVSITSVPNTKKIS